MIELFFVVLALIYAFILVLTQLGWVAAIVSTGIICFILYNSITPH
jgi:hypothetical protein